MDWINCNACSLQPGDEKHVAFKLTSCGHIFCGKCLPKDSANSKCLACSTQCQYIKLASKMKPDAEIFFKEPGELAKHQHTQLMKVIEFQKEHRTRLVSFHRKMLAKYRDSEQQIQALRAENESLRIKIRKLNDTMMRGRSNFENQPPSHYAPPDFSYRQAVNNARMSPQISPAYKKNTPSFISPGRLTLPKRDPGDRSSPMNVISPNQPAFKHISPNVMYRTASPADFSRSSESIASSSTKYGHHPLQSSMDWNRPGGYQPPRYMPEPPTSTSRFFEPPKKQFPHF